MGLDRDARRARVQARVGGKLGWKVYRRLGKFLVVKFSAMEPLN